MSDPSSRGSSQDVAAEVRRRDLRVLPLALAAWASAWLGTGGASQLVGVAVVALAVLLLLGPVPLGRVRRAGPLASGLRAQRSWVVATLLVAVVAGALGALQAHRLASGPVAELARQQAAVTVGAEVRADPTVLPAQGPRPALLLVRVRLDEVTGRGDTWRVRSPVTVLVSGAAAESWRVLPVGTRVLVTGRLQAPDPGDDVAGVLRVRTGPDAVRPPGTGARWVERVRQGLRDAVVHRKPEPRALVPALVLGDTSAVTPELVAVFQTTGLTHLTAVSGANLTLLLAFVLLAARWLGVRGWWLRGLGLAGVAVFVALCRTEPSVLRAAAMGLVALAALGAGARGAGVRNLGVAMLTLLLVDPFLARSWGFALSVLASGGIIWWARPWADILGRWLPRLVAETVTLPLAAHLTTLPVVVLLSGRVSLVGLLANALAGPFVGPATVLGFAAAGSSLVSTRLAALLGFGAAGSAQAIITVARLGAALPGASVGWPATAAAVTLLSLGCLLVALVMGWVLARRWLSVVLALALVAALLRVPTTPGWPPRGWRFVVCDIGQGDGLVLRAGEHDAVVVDTGPDPALMGRCLDGLGVRRIPLLVLTHFHADHVDGLSGVLDRRVVERLWVSPLAEPAGEVAVATRLAAAEGAAVEVPPPGTVASVGEVGLRVLGPLPPRGPEPDSSAAQNDASLVVRADVAGLSVLLPGDVEPPGQRALLAAGADLRAEVLKVPHHGSARQEPAFFAATGARLAVASAGQGNDYGHPAPKTIALPRSLGMTVLSTDRTGSVAVTGDDSGLGVLTQRPP